MGIKLELNGISYVYPRTDRFIFEEISFSVDQGEVFCLLGPNGCGKSTLLNCISGLFRVTAGEIAIGGRNINGMTKKELAASVGYVPQFHQPTYDYTVRDFVVLGRSPHISLFGRPSRHDYRLADEAIEALNIGHLRDKSYMKMSGGERQLALFARVVAQRPDFILLDEPTASLDFGNQIKIVRLAKSLAEMGFCIIMTTHHPDHALIAADTVCIFHDGRAQLTGPPSKVITSEILSRTYNTKVAVEYVDSVERSVCVAL